MPKEINSSLLLLVALIVISCDQRVETQGTELKKIIPKKTEFKPVKPVGVSEPSPLLSSFGGILEVKPYDQKREVKEEQDQGLLIPEEEQNLEEEQRNREALLSSCLKEASLPINFDAVHKEKLHLDFIEGVPRHVKTKEEALKQFDGIRYIFYILKPSFKSAKPYNSMGEGYPSLIFDDIFNNRKLLNYNFRADAIYAAFGHDSNFIYALAFGIHKMLFSRPRITGVANEIIERKYETEQRKYKEVILSLLNMIGPMAASTLRLLWFKMSDPVHYKNFSIKATKEELIVLNHAVEKYMNMLEKMYVRIYEVIDCAIGKKDHSPEIFYDTFNALINSKSIKEGARAVSYEAFEIRNLMERILNRD